MAPENNSVSSTVLSESERFKITYYKQHKKSEKLIISFDPHGHDIREKGFSSDTLIQSGFDHIFVSHKLNSQYQGLSIEDFLSAIHPIIDEYKVYTYGSSLGGYCAIYYGGCINAKAIALSPRNSAHPSIADKQFSSLTFTHTDIINTPLSKEAPIIVFDPAQKIDKDFIESYILPAYPDSTLIKLPYASHLVAEALSEVKLLKKLLLGIINENKIIDIDLGEKNSSYWNAEKAIEQLKKGDYEQAAHFLEKSLRIKHNALHLDRLITLMRNNGIHPRILENVIKPYKILIEESDLFDREWYLSQNPDIAEHPGFSLNPALHYLMFGGYEGRKPCKEFDSKFYLTKYADVRKNGMNPLIHYLRFGQHENRLTNKKTQ